MGILGRGARAIDTRRVREQRRGVSRRAGDWIGGERVGGGVRASITALRDVVVVDLAVLECARAVKADVDDANVLFAFSWVTLVLLVRPFSNTMGRSPSRRARSSR